jgi:nucleoside-diphosphate kinase
MEAMKESLPGIMGAARILLERTAGPRQPSEMPHTDDRRTSALVSGWAHAQPVPSQHAPDEVTLALIKSHIVMAGKAGQVLQWMLDRHLAIDTMLQTTLTETQIVGLYHLPTHKYWATGVRGAPVIAMVLVGPDIVGRWRQLLGSPNSSMAAPGTLRAEFGSRVLICDNVAHGSDSIPSAWYEINIVFPKFRRGCVWVTP